MYRDIADAISQRAERIKRMAYELKEKGAKK